jgi:hypothetical protein
LLERFFSTANCSCGLHQPPVGKVLIENLSAIAVFTKHVLWPNEHFIEFQTAKRIPCQTVSILVYDLKARVIDWQQKGGSCSRFVV